MTINSPVSFRAAAAAIHVVHEKARNLAKIQQTIKTAAHEGVQLLTLPEGALQGFLFHADGRIDPEETSYLWQHAETIPGPSTNQISQWASEHKMFITMGLWERVDYPATPVLHNSSVFVGPEGVVGVYRKVHQPTEETHHYLSGREWPVFETPLGTIGMMICYDQCFPEAARELVLRGADILINPNAWLQIDQASDERYDFFGRARAAENNRWLLQSNQVGPSGKTNGVFMGLSRIIAPDGMVVAQTEAGEEGLAIADITPTKFDPTRARAGWYLQQRIPSTYTTINKPYSSK
jgi:predicted amidohydrolase